MTLNTSLLFINLFVKITDRYVLFKSSYNKGSLAFWSKTVDRHIEVKVVWEGIAFTTCSDYVQNI
jgi:hypothetical protein